MPLQPLPSDYQNPMAESNFGPLFEQYKVTYGKALEFVQGNLYDTVTYNVNTLNLSVFDGTRNVTTNKILCNMPGNTLPDRQGFLVMSLQWIPSQAPTAFTPVAVATAQAGNVADFLLLGFNGIFELRLYEKLYAQVPLIMMPAACGIVPSFTSGITTTITQYANNGVADARNLYTLEEPTFIPPLVQIQAQLIWNGAQVVAQPVPMKINMGGLLVRPVQ